MSNQILALLDLETPEYTFLRRYSRQDIRKLQENGDPGFAYEEPLLFVSPVPEEDASFLAYGIFRPTAMSGDEHDPSTATYGGLAPEFHEAVVIYALWKCAEYVQHQGSGEGERWRIQYEGQDGTEGEIARIKRILAKRVTPALYRRRNLAGNIGALTDSGSYIGSRI